MLTRTFAYFTLVCYLIVGTLAVRVFLSESVSFSVSTSYLNLVTDAPLETSSPEVLLAPEIKFAAIKIPVQAEVSKKIKIAKTMVKEAKLESTKVLAANELPFHEPVTLQKIEMKQELPTNMVALYKDFSFQETILANTKVVADEVSTSMAASSVSEVSEPEFFEYPVEAVTEKRAEPVVAKQTIDNKIDYKLESDITPSEVEVQDVSDLMEVEGPAAVAESAPVEPEFFDYPETSPARPAINTNVLTQISIDKDVKKTPEVVSTSSSGIAFDYSQANQDIRNQTVPTITAMTTHKPGKGGKPRKASKNGKLNKTKRSISALDQGDKNHFAAEVEEEDAPTAFVPTTYPVSIAILALGTDLQKLEKLQGYEVRFQDDLSEMLEDYGSGEVNFEANLSQPKMTRTVTLLKRGYIPVTTEIILEEGHGSVSIPLVEEHTLNDLVSPFERKGPVGSLLVELDDETDVAKLDVSFGEVVKLNGDLKKTENEDFRYLLFVGVQAGNAMVSYHRGNGEIVSKIVHIHENEMTFDANFYEDVVNEKVRLYEEELLAKESSPLIISGEQVKIFATNLSGKKINNHTYKMPFNTSHLGGRRYLELNHQSEPVFVGIRDNTNITVPSENFMRFILSKVEGEKLGNRCLVQVNLSKKAEKFEVASESISQSLMTSSQLLDSDGKFYDSLSDKTQKIIIIGEGQGAADISPDAKINIKIQYQDGSVQFLNSYCSPNTYLVEQL